MAKVFKIAISENSKDKMVGITSVEAIAKKGLFNTPFKELEKEFRELVIKK